MPGGKKKEEEWKPEKYPKYDKCMAEKDPEGEHKPNGGGIMSKFNFEGLGKMTGLGTKEVKTRNPDGSVRESKEVRCGRIKEQEELELFASRPITGVTRPVPTKKAMELMNLF